MISSRPSQAAEVGNSGESGSTDGYIALSGPPDGRGCSRIKTRGAFAYAVGRDASGRLRAAPAWALWALLVLFPLWWALGLGTFVFPLSAVPMAVQLRRRRDRLTLPPGWGFWALFLLWTVLSLSMYLRNPPDVHPGSLSGRILATALLLVEYAAVTVTLLFVGNLTKDELPVDRIVKWLGALFVVTVVGGLVGTYAPHFQFTAPLEYLLPGRIRSNTYLSTLVHPAAAQIQAVLGADAGRASAPFGYTNFWANNLGILLVWFVCGWLVRSSRSRRVTGVVILLAAVVPIVYSLNRGLWIGLAAAVVWVVVRAVVQGRAAILAVFLASISVGAVVFALTPLHTTLSSRIDHPQSNDVRGFIFSASLKGAEESPVLGWGGTRKTNGSDQSIAIGNSPACNLCGDFTVGSVGQLSQVLFYQGFVGTFFFLGFFVRWLLLGMRERSPAGQAGVLVVALSFVFMLFYNSAPAALTITMISVGILWRLRADHAAEQVPGTPSRRRLIGRR